MSWQPIRDEGCKGGNVTRHAKHVHVLAHVTCGTCHTSVAKRNTRHISHVSRHTRHMSRDCGLRAIWDSFGTCCMTTPSPAYNVPAGTILEVWGCHNRGSSCRWWHAVHVVYTFETSPTCAERPKRFNPALLHCQLHPVITAVKT